ncbi:MAG TPA: DUF1080 domain-containing protein [Fuerstia sp.]|nr:DUF1080 domain-containing protein [Fuerstiella sp.]
MKYCRIVSSLLACVLLAGNARVVRSEDLSGRNVDNPWQELFDGQSLTGWRGYRQKEPPASGWSVTDGLLFSDGSSRTDLITTESYKDYELIVEWRTEADGNSGILIHADESTEKIAFNAPEIQIYAIGHRDPGIGHQAGLCTDCILRSKVL